MALGFQSYIVDNDRRFQRAIDRAMLEVQDLTVPFKQISQDFYRSQKSIFQLKGPGQYPDIGGFNRNERVGAKTRGQLAAERKRARVGFVYPLLKSSGLLAESVTSSKSAYSLLEIGKKNMVIGTTVPYGVYHQSDGPRRRIPQRKFLFIGPEAPQFANSDQMGRAERWLNYINDFVLAKMGAIGEVRGQKVKP
jgi:phage gpG-like protein